MTISQMLEQSGILTLLGMCVVFSFLVILIAAMNLLRVCIKCFKLDKKGKAASSSSELPVQNTSNSIPAVERPIATTTSLTVTALE